MPDSFASPWAVAHLAPLHGIIQARILEWVTISFSRESSRPRYWTHISTTLAGRFFTTEPPGKPKGEEVKTHPGEFFPLYSPYLRSSIKYSHLPSIIPLPPAPPNQPITSTELRSPLHPRSEKLLTFVGDTCVIRPHSLHSHYSLPKTSVTRSLDSRGLEKEGFTEPPHYSPVFWWPVFFEHLPYLCMGSWALPPKGLWPYFWKVSAICSPEICCVRITDIPGPRGYQMQVLPSQNRCAINIFLLHGSVYLLRSCH